MAQAALTASLSDLTALVSTLATAVQTDRAARGAPLGTTPPADIAALTAALGAQNAQTQFGGQLVRKANFNFIEPPAGTTYSLPAEPRYTIDYAVVVKNETEASKFVARESMT